MKYIQCLAATGCKGDRGCRRGEPPGWQGRRSCQECSTRCPGSHFHGMTTTSHVDISRGFQHQKHVDCFALLLCSLQHWCSRAVTTIANSCLPPNSIRHSVVTVACCNAGAASLLTIDKVTNSLPDLAMPHAWLIFAVGCTLCAAGGGSSRCSWTSSRAGSEEGSFQDTKGWHLSQRQCVMAVSGVSCLAQCMTCLVAIIATLCTHDIQFMQATPAKSVRDADVADFVLRPLRR